MQASSDGTGAGKGGRGKRVEKEGGKSEARKGVKREDSETPLQLQERAEIEQTVKAWAEGTASTLIPNADAAKDRLTFAASLSGFGRKVVHEVAESLVLPCRATPS